MDDLLLCICDHLFDRDKLMLLSITQRANQLKTKVSFKDKVMLYLIQDLFYLDSFLGVFIVHDDKLPSRVEAIRYTRPIEHWNLNVPTSLTKLRIINYPSVYDTFIVPPTVKRLSVTGVMSFQNIICPNVEQITFHTSNTYYLAEIDIPVHVFSLKIYHRICEDLKQLIPPTITHLCLDNIDDTGVFDSVPMTVTYLKIYQTYDRIDQQYISDHIVDLLIVDDFNDIQEISQHVYKNIPATVKKFVIRDKNRYEFVVR